MQSKLKLLLVAGILLLGFILRWKNYDVVPVPGDSLDEYSFTWVGLSLIKLGIPVGAIGVGGYEHNLYSYINVDRIFQTGNYASPIKINYPWFDHPPLLGLMTGGFAYLNGAEVFEDTTLKVIRKPMVGLGTLAVLLVMLLAYEYFGYWTAFWSGLIYATSPLIVVSSRMVQAENLLLIWFLLILLSIKKNRWLWVGVFTSLAFWTKFSAIAIFPVILWKIHKEDYALFLRGLLPGMFFLGIYYWVYGWETFWAVTRANSGREYAIGTRAIFNLITTTRVTHLKLFVDGWLLAGWISFFAYKKKDLLKVFIFSYLAVYILFGNFPHGWYTLPFWPILTIMLARVLVKRNELILSLLPLGVGINNIININYWRWGVFGILISIILIKDKEFLKYVALVVLVFAIVVSAFWVYKLDPTEWYKL